jgi:hypothetical protein
LDHETNCGLITIGVLATGLAVSHWLARSSARERFLSILNRVHRWLFMLPPAFVLLFYAWALNARLTFGLWPHYNWQPPDSLQFGLHGLLVGIAFLAAFFSPVAWVLVWVVLAFTKTRGCHWGRLALFALSLGLSFGLLCLGLLWRDFRGFIDWLLD